MAKINTEKPMGKAEQNKVSQIAVNNPKNIRDDLKKTMVKKPVETVKTEEKSEDKKVKGRNKEAKENKK